MDTDVLIVGAGPTGMILANELRLAGVATVVIDQLPERSSLSRAGGVHSRTIEILDQRGLLESIRATGDHHETNGHFAGIPFRPGRIGGRRSGWWVPQTTLETVLETHLRDRGSTVDRGYTLIGLAPDADGVSATMEHRGAHHTVRAAYLVAADGAHSTVRSLLALDFPGRPATTTWLIADVRLSGITPSDVARRSGRWQWGDGGNWAVLFPLDGTKVRLALGGPKHPQDRTVPITEGEVRAGLAAVYGTSVELLELGYTFRITNAARQVRQYRHGRVLLAGDAAHIHLPLGGQGMNTGVQDAYNLGWKLAAVVNGWGTEELLNSYHDERHPVAARVLRNVQAQSALLDWAGANASDAAALHELFTEMVELPEAEAWLSAMMSAHAVRYPMPGAPDHPRSGCSAPDLDLPQGRLYELLRHGRGVLISANPVVAATAAPWSDRVDTISAAGQPDSWLIRPDGYICWASTGSDPAPALSRWFGER